MWYICNVMANWSMPCMFSGDLGTLSPRLHDLMTNMTCQNAKCVHLLYICEATICSLLWSYKQVHLLSYLTFLLSVRAHIKVYHGVMLRRKIKLPSYYRPGRPCVIPTLPFKITAFFFVGVWVYIISLWQSLVKVLWYILHYEFHPCFFSLKVAPQMSLYPTKNVYYAYALGF